MSAIIVPGVNILLILLFFWVTWAAQQIAWKYCHLFFLACVWGTKQSRGENKRTGPAPGADTMVSVPSLWSKEMSLGTGALTRKAQRGSAWQVETQPAKTVKGFFSFVWVTFKGVYCQMCYCLKQTNIETKESLGSQTCSWKMLHKYRWKNPISLIQCHRFIQFNLLYVSAKILVASNANTCCKQC